MYEKRTEWEVINRKCAGVGGVRDSHGLLGMRYVGVILFKGFDAICDGDAGAASHTSPDISTPMHPSQSG